MWSDRPEYLEVRNSPGSLYCVVPLPQPCPAVAHHSQRRSSTSVPSFPHRSGLVVGESLKGLGPLYLISSDKRVPVTACGWGRRQDPHRQGTEMFRAWVILLSSPAPCYILRPGVQYSFLSQSPVLCFVFILKHCLPEMGLGPVRELLTAGL